ncbi:MAG: hypothetical protein PHQ43_11040 [Dehalococcoidales bacterium]|nr:hypothetical protein [Dehalococcoidales bacterium]
MKERARIQLGRHFAEPVKKSRKEHICNFCHHTIPAGTGYFNIYRGGAGLANLKFPDRACPACLRKMRAGDVYDN